MRNFAPLAPSGNPRTSVTKAEEARRQQKSPPSTPKSERGVNLATTYSRTPYRRTTIGDDAFHFRVRDGNGWFHASRITRPLPVLAASADAWPQPFLENYRQTENQLTSLP